MTSSLPTLAGLKEEDSTPAPPEDILADLRLYDSYEDLYDVRPRRQGYDAGGEAAAEPDVGGFVVEEVWEKTVRASVASLWTMPLGWEEKEAPVKVEEVVMTEA